ncbi:hypothetical protein GCM10010145_04590 [Streptomyces ruber]|uniref:RNA polymerase sigma factor 70 region 4 type 2 domain-containing protein n=2 Tax=Streptomyces TaxID=1883 RepID=A0A918B713_9ACTN|nr:hypothetical protein GCM10010145_04590 [Streptomyces ruber]
MKDAEGVNDVLGAKGVSDVLGAKGVEDGAGSGTAAPGAAPAQAFDALYALGAPALVRQVFLLTGRPRHAHRAVERAFQLAWQHWPEVAVDRDPAGWVRAAAHEYALSPWRRLRPRIHRRASSPSSGSQGSSRDPAGRVLADVLLELPPPYRRALLLYDGLGLGLPETAAEIEASTPAAASRLLNAREAVAAQLPGLADPEALRHSLREALREDHVPVVDTVTADRVRTGGERRARLSVRAAAAFTVLLTGTTVLTLRVAPDRYEAPASPGAVVQGLPPRVAPGPLSHEQLELREKLRRETVRGPHRLVPEGR